MVRDVPSVGSLRDQSSHDQEAAHAAGYTTSDCEVHTRRYRLGDALEFLDCLLEWFLGTAPAKGTLLYKGPIPYLHPDFAHAAVVALQQAFHTEAGTAFLVDDLIETSQRRRSRSC